MSCIRYEGAQPLSQTGHLVEDFLCIKRLTTIRLDDPICILQITNDARTQNIWDQRIGRTDTPTTRLVLVSGTDASQRRADPLVSEPLFAGVIKCPMVWKDQMSSRTNLHALRRDFDSLCRKAVCFFEERLGINNHPAAQHAGFAFVNDS